MGAKESREFYTGYYNKWYITAFQELQISVEREAISVNIIKGKLSSPPWSVTKCRSLVKHPTSLILFKEHFNFRHNKAQHWSLHPLPFFRIVPLQMKLYSITTNTCITGPFWFIFK